MFPWKLVALNLLGAWLAAAPAAIEAAGDRPADKILAEIKAVTMPDFQKVNQSHQAEVAKFFEARSAALNKKAELVGELYKADPNNAELARLLPERWRTKFADATLAAEVDEVLARTRSDELRREASKLKIDFAMRNPVTRQDPETLVNLIDEFTANYPEYDEAAQMLDDASHMTRNEKVKADLIARIARQYPDSIAARRMATADRRREAIGKPFVIEFTDAIEGRTVSSAGLKGKVVVVDFWATWCDPCVAEMPRLKELYAKYKGQGVEFIGVSLDQPEEEGGLDQLKKFVADNRIGWPQYYQGRGGLSEFSSRWGITAVPCFFLVDADGNLASVDAWGKLETLIPEYLAKAKGAKEAARP